MAEYRDASRAALLRYQRERERVEERAAGVTERLLQCLPDELRRLLDQRKAALHEPEATLESVQQAEEALERFDRVLDEVFARAPELEADYNELPDVVGLSELLPDRSPPPDLMMLRSFVPPHDALRRVVIPLDPTAKFRTRRNTRWLTDALFRAEGVPFYVEINRTPGWAEHEVEVATSVRKSSPTLVLSPESWSDAIPKLLKWTRDVEIGNLQMDGRFLIDATGEAAKQLLTRAVCRDLLKVAELDVPRLRVGAGHARMSWCYPEAGAALSRLSVAVRLLTAIRRAARPIALL